jgi:hypothetical protein
MSQHSESAMVQLSALLCLVPLALENSALQVGLPAPACTRGWLPTPGPRQL